MADLQGFRVKRKIVCQGCGMPRDKGGFMVKDGPAPGVYCSAEHARRAVEEKEGD